jgi:hypothetical protein
MDSASIAGLSIDDFIADTERKRHEAKEEEARQLRQKQKQLLSAEERCATAALRKEAEMARHEEIRKRRNSTNTVNSAPSPALHVCSALSIEDRSVTM